VHREEIYQRIHREDDAAEGGKAGDADLPRSE
jgi:sRNA-binding carbon storage regulator CsrA